MMESSGTPRPRRTARHRVMDMIARRDHSEKEIRTKLADKEHTPAEIEDALDYARDNRWLAEPEVISERMANFLHRRNKGVIAINHKLREKGLPSVASDPEQELEKALYLAQTKWSKEEPPDRSMRDKIGRFLLSRGFEPSIVRKVIYEKL